MSELKQCPFCGGNAIYSDDFGDVTIQCEKCHAEINRLADFSIGAAVKAWNTRADGWVSVNEMLPEENGLYLIFTNGCRQLVAYSNDLGGWLDTRPKTHWMPLPEPPAHK